MKVIILIPCLNEAETLPLVLQTIPRRIPGVDVIETLIVDDGSTDETIAIAKRHGVQHILRHPKNQGLARSFHDGVNRALELGADIIVNTDGDNQYPQERIPDLVKPIIDGQADMVIADRQVDDIEHFSTSKKIIQKLGTKILNAAAGTNVPDAPSGFRAYSKEAVMRLNVVTQFSYAMETIIQAGNKRLSIVSVPVKTNPKMRESRLFKSSWEHVRKSGMAIIRAFIMYKPWVLFVSLGVFLLVLGLVPFARYSYFFLFSETHGARHLQSLIGGSVLLIASFISFTLGIIADLTRINRSLIEDSLEQAKRARFNSSGHVSDRSTKK